MLVVCRSKCKVIVGTTEEDCHKTPNCCLPFRSDVDFISGGAHRVPQGSWAVALAHLTCHIASQCGHCVACMSLGRILGRGGDFTALFCVAHGAWTSEPTHATSPLCRVKQQSFLVTIAILLCGTTIFFRAGIFAGRGARTFRHAFLTRRSVGLLYQLYCHLTASLLAGNVTMLLVYTGMAFFLS